MEILTIIHSRKIEYIPIIYEFADKAESHILFYDHADKQYAVEIKASIEQFQEKKGFISKIEMIEVDEDSKNDMQKITQRFRNDNPNLYLNGAGADTALFTVLSSIVLSHHGKVIAYDKEDNSYNLIAQNGFTSQKIQKSMKIEDFVMLMGDELLEEVAQEKILKREDALELLFSDAKQMFKVRHLLKINKKIELKGRYLDILKALKDLDIVDKNYKLRGQDGFVRFGYLFEDFVYLQLIKFAFDDVKVGVKIRFDKQQVENQNIEVSNEFDILVIKENKIGFVECKLGDSLEPLHTIYKSDSIWIILVKIVPVLL